LRGRGRVRVRIRVRVMVRVSAWLVEVGVNEIALGVGTVVLQPASEDEGQQNEYSGACHGSLCGGGEEKKVRDVCGRSLLLFHRADGRGFDEGRIAQDMPGLLSKAH